MIELYFEDTKIMNSLVFKYTHWNYLSTHPAQPQLDFRHICFLNINTIQGHITDSNPPIAMIVIVCGLLITWNSFKGYHKRYILDTENRLSRQISSISQRRVYLAFKRINN